MTCLMVSACSSARSMRWATSARGTDQPPLRFCPHAVRYVPVSGLSFSRGGRTTQDGDELVPEPSRRGKENEDGAAAGRMRFEGFN